MFLSNERCVKMAYMADILIIWIHWMLGCKVEMKTCLEYSSKKAATCGNLKGSPSPYKKWEDVDTATLCKIVGEYWKTFEETMSFVSSASTDGLDWVRDPYSSKLFWHCSHFPRHICERWMLRWALMTTWLCVYKQAKILHHDWV